MSENAETREDVPQVQDPSDPRPLSQIQAEHGARDGLEAGPNLRGPERASADRYAAVGIMGAPGSEVPEGGEAITAEGVRPASQVEAEDGTEEATDDVPVAGNNPSQAEPEKSGDSAEQ